jgi:hypothetical protein
LRPYEKEDVIDKREPIYPKLDLVKPSAPVFGMGVAKDPNVLSPYEIDKLYEKVCGPQSYYPEYKLTE